MASHIVSLLPNGRIYVEPFCGSAAVFFKKSRSKVEVLNDIDWNVMNFYQVVQNSVTFHEMIDRITYYPFSHSLYLETVSNNRTVAPYNTVAKIQSAIDFLYALMSSFSGSGYTDRAERSWRRSREQRDHVALSCSGWLYRFNILPLIHERLQGVILRNEEAIKVIQEFDTVDTVFYLDPPYHPDTRGWKSGMYQKDVGHGYHVRLVEILKGLHGKALLSCYWHDVYNVLLESGWKRYDRNTFCGSFPENIRPRIETVLVKE